MSDSGQNRSCEAAKLRLFTVGDQRWHFPLGRIQLPLELIVNLSASAPGSVVGVSRFWRVVGGFCYRSIAVDSGLVIDLVEAKQFDGRGPSVVVVKQSRSRTSYGMMEGYETGGVVDMVVTGAGSRDCAV